jgi:bifunctional NMN adenylyltransferase/nudix hydrolase
MTRKITDPEEIAFVEQYVKDVQSGKFPVQCLAVDAVVFWRNKVLMVKRKNFPQKGAWALPGGFVNETELLYDAAVRECEEETGIELQPRWFFGTKYFDAPDRAPGVRILSNAFAFEIPYYLDFDKLPKGGDDAEDAKWFDILEILEQHPDTFMEDHYWMIAEMYLRDSVV